MIICSFFINPPAELNWRLLTFTCIQIIDQLLHVDQVLGAGPYEHNPVCPTELPDVVIGQAGHLTGVFDGVHGWYRYVSFLHS